MSWDFLEHVENLSQIQNWIFFDIFNTKFYLRQNFYKDVKKHVGLKQLIQVLYNPWLILALQSNL
jgi:hypothetical protein